MTQLAMNQVRETVEAVYRAESRHVLATLIRLLGDFDLAEEGLADAFAAALEQWPREGVPANPRAWLVSAGRFRAIDAVRRGRGRHSSGAQAHPLAVAQELGQPLRGPTPPAAPADAPLRPAGHRPGPALARGLPGLL